MIVQTHTKPTPAGLNFILFLIILLITVSAKADKHSEQDYPWNEYKRENGLVGYERNVFNSKYIESRAEVVIESPVEVIYQVLKDVDSYPKWMHECKQATLLNEQGSSMVLYLAQGAPFNSRDRDVVLEATTKENLSNREYTIKFQKVASNSLHHPLDIKRDNRLWMNKFRGSWNLRMVDRDNTKVTFTLFSDPGGFAPGFITNSVTRKASFLSLKGMIAMVREDKYSIEATRSEMKKRIEAALEQENLLFYNSD